jgi:hypothetical protein
MDSGKPEPTVDQRLKPFRWPAVAVCLSLIALLAFLAFLWFTKRVYHETLADAGKAGEFVARGALTIAEKFMHGRITQTFTAALPELVSAGSGNLELALLQETETFRAEDQKSILWDTVYLGKTVSEIRVPVTYRYHVRLNDPWKLEVSGQTCLVLAPVVRPSLPPAIHTEGLEKKSAAGWARFNAQEQMDALERSITPTLNRYAADPRRMSLLREQCRKAVAEFVRNWLLKEDQWRTDRFRAIRVIFADETELQPESSSPTLELR